MEKQNLSVGDVSRRWGVSRSTVLAIIDDKKLPAFAVRKTENRTTYRIKLADVEAYEAQGATSNEKSVSRLAEVGAS